MARDHLNPGGVVSLWIPLYESNIPTAKSVLGTFFKVFPQGIIWSNDIKGEGYDAVLFGRTDATKINIDEMQARLDRRDYALVKQSLADVSINSAVDLLLTYAGSAPRLQNWMKDAEINTDRNLRLQYLAGMWLNSYVGREILSDMLKDYQFPTDIFSGSPERVAELKKALEDEGRARFATGVAGHAGTPENAALVKDILDALAAKKAGTPAK
jgi:spermidine synthase